jgi:hypothetical protein
MRVDRHRGPLVGGEASMWWSHADAATYRDWIEQAGLSVVAQEIISEGDGVHALFWARRLFDRLD